MKLITPEISWHQKEPIFSLHFCPKTWKLATGGADSTIKIWLVKEKKEAEMGDGDEEDSIGVEFLSNLDRHAKPVNVVRFSPNGNLLASAGDDGTIILWKLNAIERCTSSDFNDDDAMNKESWLVHKMLRGHIEDVYDLAWSPDSAQLISGSVDNSSIIWDAVEGRSQKILTDHKHYVQGVCWDPRSFYVATHSSDRSCRLYDTKNHKCLFNIAKNTMSYEKDGQLTKTKYSRMFMDETMQSFFRRCTFSTDGSFLFLPAGLCDGDEKKPKKTTYVFARGHYKRPIRHLPGGKKATVAVKCSPIVYELIEDKENQTPLKENNEYFKLPYRMIYAVASLDAITVYDTQHEFPIGHCANMHYASLTDIAWSTDGQVIVISSTDGYVSFIQFEKGELGTPITYDPIEYQLTQAKIRKKKIKKETKKKETEKPETDAGDDKKAEDVGKKCPLPCDPKEKEKAVPVKPLVDRKQPTIEKLFVTPIRKRKRTTEGSPNSTGEVKKAASSPDLINRGATPIKSTPPGVQSMEVNPLLTSPLTHRPASLHKQPKRIQVVTLSTADENSPSGEAPLNPKRATVISLNSDGSDKLPIVKTPKRVTVISLNSDGSEKSPIVKTPKRATVISLNSDGSDKLPIVKTPKRATVISLNADGSEKSPIVKIPKRATVISLNADGSEKSPIVLTSPIKPTKPVASTPGTSGADKLQQGNPLMSPNKTPKRVTVTTLSRSGNEKSPAPNPLTSPNKTPKRVTVTTLSSTNVEKPVLLLSPKVPKRVSVTTLSLSNFSNSPKSEEKTSTPSVTPSKAGYPAMPPSSPVIPKQPKRITVQTLSTFTEMGKNAADRNEEEETISCVPVQVDPPQLDDLLSQNSFDASLIETALVDTEKMNVSGISEQDEQNKSSGGSKIEAILID